ncbi:hypothetical protein EDD29_0123 [Actinocorallia herbida]|uniref:Uncharacterized protein n=1 Tax=Actinocorallia herbida TaxID=58109 RepID=A0A3N1CMW5_9ACTN|nr:hypothetical protein [Actinocorallia herbida]ROO82642.1 hypothetical protein EDD29_0123 [Actinocorallia herbida]
MPDLDDRAHHCARPNCPRTTWIADLVHTIRETTPDLTDERRAQIVHDLAMTYVPTDETTAQLLLRAAADLANSREEPGSD